MFAESGTDEEDERQVGHAGICYVVVSSFFKDDQERSGAGP